MCQLHSRHKEHTQDSKRHGRELQIQIGVVSIAMLARSKSQIFTSRSACLPLLLSWSNLPKLTRCENQVENGGPGHVART